jgi:integrase
MIALHTGARKGAIEQLLWSQVDLDRGRIQFNPPGRVQTKKRRAVVPISDKLFKILSMVDEREGYVIGGKGGTVRTAFETAVKRASLKEVTPHTLRHTWATWAAQAGTSMWEIAGVLGDTIATVEKRYAHHHPDYLRAAVNFNNEE